MTEKACARKLAQCYWAGGQSKSRKKVGLTEPVWLSLVESSSWMEMQRHSMTTTPQLFLTCDEAETPLHDLIKIGGNMGKLFCRLIYFACYGWVDLEKTGWKIYYGLLIENSNEIIEHYSMSGSICLWNLPKNKEWKKKGLSPVIYGVYLVC